MRAFAASAFLPPVILFLLWALAAWHGTRGPAGAAGDGAATCTAASVSAFTAGLQPCAAAAPACKAAAKTSVKIFIIIPSVPYPAIVYHRGSSRRFDAGQARGRCFLSS